MKVLTLRGSAFERGCALGAAYAELIAQRAQTWAEPLTRFRGWDRQRLEQVAGNMLRYMLEHTPELMEEMRGVAEATGLGLEEIFYLNCEPAITFVGRGPEGGGSCSNWVALTSDCGPMLGKTEDMGFYPGINVDRVFAIHQVAPTAGLRYVVAARPGFTWASAGINEAGLAIGQSSGPWGPGQDGRGVSYCHLVKHLLQFCATTGDAVPELFRLASAGKGYIFMLADLLGAFSCVEKWGEKTAVRRPEDGRLFCSNLFMHPTMQFLPPRYDAENAQARYHHLAALYRAAQGRYSEAFMKQVLTYHADVGSICRHGTDTPADFGGYSFGFLFYCRERALVVYEGPPCSSAARRFTVNF